MYGQRLLCGLVHVRHDWRLDLGGQLSLMSRYEEPRQHKAFNRNRVLGKNNDQIYAP